ncbi:MAG: hypothetical protein V9G04_07815 [Nocardioides sp.]|jgi:hypothetical protein
MALQQHDFGRPWAAHRKRIYFWMGVLCFFVTIPPWIGVMLEWWSPEPMGTIAAGAVCVPIMVPLFAAWWDAPGENRTTLEKAYEFMLVWFPISALSQGLWELTWLVGDALGYMNLTEDQHWGWFWWFYGAADTRFLLSDPGIYGMETVVVVCGAVLMYHHWILIGKGRHDDKIRVRSIYWCAVALTMMQAVIFIYYVSEARSGFAFIEQGFWGFALKFVFMNLPWLFSPMILIPLIPKMLAYLHAKNALVDAGVLTESGETTPAQAALKS